MDEGGDGVPTNTGFEGIETEASEVLPAPPGHPRFPLLDSLRAFAAISVMLVHVGIYTGGFQPWYKQLLAHLDIGVPFFFLLSGFLLYRPMLAARVSPLPKQKVTAYARNRFFRIVPAYWLVLVVAALVPGFYGAFSGNWWVYWGLLQNFPIYTPEGKCLTDPLQCGVPVAWSLSIEVFFYLVLPFYALGMAALNRLVGHRHWIPLELSVLALIAAVSLWIQSSVPLTDLHTWLFYSPLGRGWWFALGMGLAVASVWSAQRPSQHPAIRWIASHPNLWWIAGGLLYAFTAIVVLDPTPSLAFPIIDGSDYMFQVVSFGIVALLLLLPAIFGFEGGGVVRGLLRHPVFVRLGLISYGIFLWHVPVLQVLIDLGINDLAPNFQLPVVALATFIGTVIMASLSYFIVEKPLMLWSRRHSQTSAG